MIRYVDKLVSYVGRSGSLMASAEKSVYHFHPDVTYGKTYLCTITEIGEDYIVLRENESSYKRNSYIIPLSLFVLVDQSAT